MSYSETETRVVGNYLIVSTVSVCEGAGNPLDDDEYAGEIHGNVTQYRAHWGDIGTESDFCSARGLLSNNDYRYDTVEIDDFMEQAALLVVLETPFDAAMEVVQEHWELDEEERADEVAFRAQVHKLFGEHVMKEYNGSSPKLPDDMDEKIKAKARILAEQAIASRAVGDKYAVPLSLSGYNEMELKPDLHQSFVEMTESDILWVPRSLRREEYDAMPYEEAMKLAVEHATADAEQYAHWASGNVFDVEVKAYLMEWDEELGEFNESADRYEDEEAVWEDRCSHFYGREEADKEVKSMEESAEEHINELQVAIASAKPSSSSSMSM